MSRLNLLGPHCRQTRLTCVAACGVRACAADYGGALICQKGAFLAGTHDLGIEMEFTKKLTTGFFGECGDDSRSDLPLV